MTAYWRTKPSAEGFMDPSPLRDARSDLDSESSQPLWLLLAAITGVDDEHERVRLAATGIPSLLRCSMSGIAVRNERNPLGANAR